MLVNQLGRAVICDFGLARVATEEPTGLTTPTPHTGTIRYASPELLLADVPHHTWESDIRAWGCLLLFVRPPQRAITAPRSPRFAILDHDWVPTLR